MIRSWCPSTLPYSLVSATTLIVISSAIDYRLRIGPRGLIVAETQFTRRRVGGNVGHRPSVCIRTCLSTTSAALLNYHCILWIIHRIVVQCFILYPQSIRRIQWIKIALYLTRPPRVLRVATPRIRTISAVQMLSCPINPIRTSN